MLTNPTYAAIINLGCGPIVSLVLSILAAGAIAWLLTWILDTFLKTVVKEPFFGWARKIIIVACIVYVVLVVLQIVFGINLFINVSPVCG